MDNLQEEQLTLFVADSPVKTSALPESARDWLESEADYGSSFVVFSLNLRRAGWSLRTSPVYLVPMEGETLPSSFEGWENSGIYRPGASLMLSSLEFPSAAAVCSLSQVLEADAPQKYYLSPRACQGILRRAEKRGKSLPPFLQASLEQVAQQ